MKYTMQFNLLIIFTLIYIYLIGRILINNKFSNNNIVRELFLTGFVIAIISIITLTFLDKSRVSPIILFIPLGFFVFICIEASFKDALIICCLFALCIELVQLALPLQAFVLNDILLSMIGGFIGIFISYIFAKKISA